MKEKTLLKIALITSLVGLFILFIVSEYTSLSETSLDELDKIDFGKKVKVQGVVDKVIDTDKVLIVDVIEPQTVSIVVFKEDDFTLREGARIEVIGSLEEYNSETEIIADKIRVIS